MLLQTVRGRRRLLCSICSGSTEWKARETIASLSRLPLSRVDLAQSLRTAEIKAVPQMPYIDCVAAALAALRQSVSVTSDRDFEKLKRRFPILGLSRP
jgi:predicted nucleic acid-binding protein